MKRYEEYKDSGVQWFGKIPSHWIIGKLKYMAKVYTGKTPSTNNDNYYREEDINWITPGDISDNNYYIAEVQNKISRIAIEDNACQLYPSSSIFVVCVGTIGKVCLTTFDASCNQQINVLVPNGCNNKFLTYYIMSIKEILKLNANASLLAIISQEKTKNIVTLIPPINEQQSIASFLDAKTKPIDNIISKREKQIGLLEEMKSAIISHTVTKGLNPDAKMKDSGIEWIGKMPEGWKLLRFRFLCRISTGDSDTQDAEPDGEYPFYVRSPQVERSSKFTSEGDAILMAGDGAGAGRVFHHVNGKYAVHQRVYIFNKFNKIADSDYLFQFMRIMFPQRMNMGSAQSTVPSVRLHMIQNFVVTIPPIEEQKSIAFYLDSEISKFEARIAKRRRQIELLQEYKQALITDAVTGKIDVRGFNS